MTNRVDRSITALLLVLVLGLAVVVGVFLWALAAGPAQTGYGMMGWGSSWGAWSMMLFSMSILIVFVFLVALAVVLAAEGDGVHGG